MENTLKKYPKIFITGGTGWLGKRLVQALTLGLNELGEIGYGNYQVHCLVPPGEHTRPLLDMGAYITVGNLSDKECLEDFLADAEDGLLIHTAGIIHPPGFLGKTSLFNKINVQGTENLLSAAILRKIKRFVVMSSNSPFGGNPSVNHKFTEESPYNPYMEYGHSKWRMELLLKEVMENDKIDTEIVVIRAPWFYGPGQPERQTLFFSMIKEGKFPILGSGLNKRSMGYVDSLVLGLLHASRVSEAKNQVFWLADEEPYTMLEIISTIREVLKEDFAIKVIDKNIKLPSIISDIARLADKTAQAIGVYQQKIHVLSEMNMTIACDISKAKRLLKYQPLCSLREGMRRSISWCIERGQKF